MVDEEGRAYVSDLRPKWPIIKSKHKFLSDKFVKKSLFSKSTLNRDLSNTEESASKFIKVAGQIASANSAEEVKNILSKTALPIASYKVKRKKQKNIMVTAYVGAGVTCFADSSRIRATFNAPIGIEHTFNTTWPGKTSSFSIMASLLDLGNVFEYDSNSEGSYIWKHSFTWCFVKLWYQ